MARSTKMRLRDLWLQVHKWIGLALAILIIPISVTGAVLVWDEPVDKLLHPARYAVSGGEAMLGPAAYAEAAAKALAPGDRVASIRYPGEAGPVTVSATPQPKPGAAARPGPPQRISVWLDPADGRVLDKASSNSGLLRTFHVIHGSLMVPGVGRQIVGWVGVAMFISCLTGIWLWWPVTGSVTKGFRWKRQNSTNANLHHLLGFWILIPLAMLSFTGFWISFPGVFGTFDARPQAGAQGKAGEGARGGEGRREGRAKGKAGAEKGGDPMADRMRAMRARPLETTQMTADAALAAVQGKANGALASVTWPTDQSSEWKIAFAREGGAPAEYSIDDATGEVKPPRPPRPETLSRTMRRWHDGTGMGPVWQAVIFLGGLIPAILSVTGIIMWWNARKWRMDLKRRKQAKAQAAAAPAE